ncbi:Up-regulated during septation-domain-containing protein [Daldinia decipiens]|uniref:Up-regulated during septation-domain-containing protein n=1 Tax=Daldinia decipiens TaxID=326647 RepID=UPI0020C4A00D|nr:Up-regulated during septation-domain-containing protein [Daldinia decipiens]KAI1657344.1 Up-regulated during septation-domain-containing protein [Daldinia decipiens]
MAHIAACMFDGDGEFSSLRSYIANAFSAQASTESLSSTSSCEEKKPFVWRMQNPETRKYQLFPREKQLPSTTSGKQLDPEQAFAMAMGQTDKASVGSGLRMRIKEHNLNRRRKISVPELGPMTTVQEVAMDSPTIPGRPALHERSISTPINTWRQRQVFEFTTTSVRECEEENLDLEGFTFRDAQPSASTPKQPLSPKDLAPLTIPTQSGPIPRLVRQLSLSRLRSRDTQQEPTIRLTRAEESPKTRTPFTPASSSVSATTPMSTTTAMTNSTLPTPLSAPAECRSSPRPWDRQGSTTPITTMQQTIDPTAAPKVGPEIQPRASPSPFHRRGQSDSGSIMDRGRPRKRSDGTPIGNSTGLGIGGLKRSSSKRSLSAERRAFENLPQGWKPSEALKNIDSSEITYLQKQALGQTLRFEVLTKEDVENLSKELRHLDERTEYLRRTYTSLRAGRRNLHSRICQYLRSPRVAKFSYESMLKQEETLAELDASIDDWVTKLEQAENRRTRVRQKLLEHVAAASTLSVVKDLCVTSDVLQQAMGVRVPNGTSDISTPPRSPTKNTASIQSQSPSPSSSPQRVVARVPSMIPELPFEEAEDDVANGVRKNSMECTIQRMESIRIYADSDVYALLADVESEFTKLNVGIADSELTRSPRSEEQRRILHRARSHDIINNQRSKGLNKMPPTSPPAPAPPMKNSPAKEQADVFLSAAVFQPGRTPSPN